jgi:uncharacterized protein (TIGR03435 family)
MVMGSLAFAQRPKFEVASVRPNTTNGQPSGATPQRSGDLVMFHNTQPFSLIYYAYHLKGNYELVGYTPPPDTWSWVDVDARAGADATDDQVRLMVQSLLEDRFKLKIHRETKDFPGYQLSIATGKAKLTPSSEVPMKVTIDGRTFTPGPGCGTAGMRDGSHTICRAATMETIAAQLSNSLKAPVVDRTGLTGTYDLHLRYIPDERALDPNMEPGPSLTRALQEDFGLTLKKGTAPVEVLVIDHMEKPSEN